MRPGARPCDGAARRTFRGPRREVGAAGRHRNRTCREQLCGGDAAGALGTGGRRGGGGLARRARGDRRRVPNSRRDRAGRGKAGGGRHHQPHADRRLPACHRARDARAAEGASQQLPDDGVHRRGGCGGARGSCARARASRDARSRQRRAGPVRRRADRADGGGSGRPGGVFRRQADGRSAIGTAGGHARRDGTAPDASAAACRAARQAGGGSARGDAGTPRRPGAGPGGGAGGANAARERGDAARARMAAGEAAGRGRDRGDQRSGRRRHAARRRDPECGRGPRWWRRACRAAACRRARRAGAAA